MNGQQIKTWLDGKKTKITAVSGGLVALGNALSGIMQWVDGKIEFTQLVDLLQTDLGIIWVAAMAIFVRMGVQKTQVKEEK